MSTGTRLDDTFRSMSEELEAEAARLIAYLNDKVVPEVRQSSSVALRVASEKLRRLAEQLEYGSQPGHGKASAAHESANR